MAEITGGAISSVVNSTAFVFLRRQSSVNLKQPSNINCARKRDLSKYAGKRLLGRPRHRREDNIRTDLKEIIRGIGLIRFRIGVFGEPL